MIEELLKPLEWDWSYGDGGKTNAVCRAKSPSHEYIIRLEAGGDFYVDYRKFDNDEDSDNRKDEPPVFDSIKAAQDWVQLTHYPSKMAKWIGSVNHWISIEDKLPDEEGFYLVYLFDGSLNVPRVVVKWWQQKWFEGFLPWDYIDEVTHWQKLPEPPKGVDYE